MSKSNTGKREIDIAMSEVCLLFNSGELRASTDIAGFLRDVAKEIRILRDYLEDAVDLAGGGCLPHDEILDEWKKMLGG